MGRVLHLLTALLAATAAFAVSTAYAALPAVASSFRDCPQCPEMVMVPAGTFIMGSPESEKVWAVGHGATPAAVADEAPRHSVSLWTFALGKYDVTRGEYAVFAKETGYPASKGCGWNSYKWDEQKGLNWRNPGFPQTDQDPVVCVSWQDAQAYVIWLNGKLGKSGGKYRLPTEAEWEYAARSGGGTRFWWGDDDAGAADHAWFEENSHGGTHPVGMKPANAFGLYDMVGNVWQWTADCYADSYSTAPTDGSPVASVSGCKRVDRGGAWLYPAWLLRSATRERNPADFHDAIMGFRVAKSLPQ